MPEELSLTLVDCPGYGFAKASGIEKENWRKLMGIYLKKSPFLHRVIILVDIQRGLAPSDNMLVEMLSA